VFPAHHIDGVGTLQDAGLLENDPEMWARAEVKALFRHLEEPDFVVSIGTGEPAPSNYDVSTERQRTGMFARLWHLCLEKSRDKAVRRASSMAQSAGFRLNIDLEGDEPRLDDTSSIPKLLSTVATDASLHPKIDALARRMVASLFYFKLKPSTRKCASDKYLLTGKILCLIGRGEPAALEALLAKLTTSRGRFMVNGAPIAGAIPGGSFLGEDGNFEVLVNQKSPDKLTITLDMGEAGAYDISRSPFSVQKLVAAQGLDAPFGTSDHRKRKRTDNSGNVSVKRRRAFG
jgi:hypothetical protein